MVRKQDATNLAWLDLEMTGLDANQHVILQAALIVTTAQLEPLEEMSFDIWQPETELAHMSPFVRNMHDTNGLLKRCRESKTEARDAEKKPPVARRLNTL